METVGELSLNIGSHVGVVFYQKQHLHIRIFGGHVRQVFAMNNLVINEFQWEKDSERCSCAWRTFNTDFAIEGGHQLLNQIQADAAAALSGNESSRLVIDPVERVEYLLKFRLIDETA